MYNDTFKDKVNGVELQYVYGVQDNGDVYIVDFVCDSTCKDYCLGNYPNRDQLPKNSYNWDIDSIPAVKEFHGWIAEKVKLLSEFVELKVNLEASVTNTNSKDELVTLLESTLKLLIANNESRR